MPKTPEEIAAEEAAASKEQREQLARDANKKRNDAMLEARNAIADRADDIKTEEDDLVPLTDAEWDQNDRPDQVSRKSRAERIAAQDAAEDAAEEEEEFTEDEAAARLIREKEALDRDQDEAREAGADDSRENAEGELEYRVEVAGKVKWLTLKGLRELAGDVSDTADSGQGDKKGATTPRTQTPSPEAVQARRQAEERRQAEKATLRAKLKDLNTRASMGDDAAIDELTDLQLNAITGDSDRIQRMVDERVDARVEGKTVFDRAVQWFEAEYSDLLSDPDWKQYAAAQDLRLAQADPELSPKDRLAQVGEKMRKMSGKAKQGRKEPPPRESKLDRKRNAPQVPQAAGRTRPDVEPDETETASQAIQRMAQSRGQARAISHKH